VLLNNGLPSKFENAEKHLRLVIDKRHRAIIRRKQPFSERFFS